MRDMDPFDKAMLPVAIVSAVAISAIILSMGVYLSAELWFKTIALFS